MLYSASADGPKDELAKDDDEEDEEMELPARAVAGESSPRASSLSAAAAASSGLVDNTTGLRCDRLVWLVLLDL